MINMTTAQAALKDLYLGVLSNQLNTDTDPLLNIIKKSSASVYGRNVVKLVPYGLNAGISAGDETGELPNASGNKYLNFTTSLKNLYGSIEISDKAIRASNNDKGAFVNLLNAEMESLLYSSKFNLARMLFGDGTGELFTIVSATSATKTLVVDKIANVMEGMIVDFYYNDSADTAMQGVKVIEVRPTTNEIVFDTAFSATLTTANKAKYKVYLQNSKDQELTGLGAIFGNSTSLYGLTRADYACLTPYQKAQGSTETFDETLIQKVLDDIEFQSGNSIDTILADTVARGKLLTLMATYRKNMDFMNLQSGAMTMTYNGIPVLKNRFSESGAMMFLNSKDFEMHQLCDWEWLTNEDGSILKQKENYAIFQATLVKYADIICNKPSGQGKLKNIS